MTLDHPTTLLLLPLLQPELLTPGWHASAHFLDSIRILELPSLYSLTLLSALTFGDVSIEQVRSHSKQFQHFLELILDWTGLTQATSQVVQKIQTYR